MRYLRTGGHAHSRIRITSYTTQVKFTQWQQRRMTNEHKSRDLRSFVIRFDFDSYWWPDSKISNRPRCQSSFVKKRLVVVKFAFKVDIWSKISLQQHCLTRLWLNWNKQVLSSEFRSPYITLIRHKYKIPMDEIQHIRSQC